MKKLVLDFYARDDISRMMPGTGKSGRVSISRGVHVQKRLLLHNLSEIYALFKLENPKVRIGKSSFYALKPEW